VPQVEINAQEDVVALPYSSGTTGLAKGVMLTHRNLVANLCQFAPFGFVGEEDTVIGVLPFYHIYGLTVILSLSLANGATVVSLPRFDLLQFLQVLQDYRVTVGNMVPPIMLALARQPVVEDYDLSHMRVILSAAAPLGKELQEACAARLNCLVVQAWGLTETSPDVTFHPLTPGAIKWGSAGVCNPNSECKVVDVATGEELEANQEGEICARGPQIMKGYLNNPAATAAMLDPDGWLHTGDIGYLDADGYLHIVDRKKDLIIRGGFNVYPRDVEDALVQHPAVQMAAVVGRPSERHGEEVVAFVSLAPDAQMTADELIDWAREHIGGYKYPREVHVVDAIPLTAVGKIDRKAVRARVAVSRPTAPPTRA
jgi:acyl-CoA synthetase (AMP-forming)/AMP-acid ligase II